MRISVDKQDPGYRDDVPLWDVRVYLNGQLATMCITADEEEGIAICYDPSPEAKLRASDKGEPERVTLRGEVRIVTRDEKGVCTMCKAGPAELHATRCPRADTDLYAAQSKKACDREVAFGDPTMSGGVVENAVGRRYIVGERGPEAIIPLPPVVKVQLGPLYSERKRRAKRLAAINAARKAHKARPRVAINPADEGVHRAITAFANAGANRKANEL